VHRLTSTYGAVTSATTRPSFVSRMVRPGPGLLLRVGVGICHQIYRLLFTKESRQKRKMLVYPGHLCRHDFHVEV